MNRPDGEPSSVPETSQTAEGNKLTDFDQMVTLPESVIEASQDPALGLLIQDIMSSLQAKRDARKVHRDDEIKRINIRDRAFEANEQEDIKRLQGRINAMKSNRPKKKA